MTVILQLLSILIASIMAIDPEVYMTASEIISHWGYPVEEFKVVTKDGYILGLQRIPPPRDNSRPHKKHRPIVLFAHGLVGDSTSFISNPPNESAPFLFADAGFDVWLGNVRGNTYSRNHTYYNVSGQLFWEFSWVEHALYDLPAIIDTILDHTGEESLYYVGHSQGALLMFAKLSVDPSFGKKIKQFFALSPSINLKHMKGLLPKLARYLPLYEATYKKLGSFSFLENYNFLKLMAHTLCSNEILVHICSEFVFMFAGPDENGQLNMSRTPVYVSHSPSGTSWKNVVHWAQMSVHGLAKKNINYVTLLAYNGVTSFFDYGPQGNKLHYGTSAAPPFNFSTITTDMHIFISDDDILSDSIDNYKTFLPSLNPQYIKSVTNLKGYSHLHFIWGIRAAEDIYIPIIKLIKKDFGVTSK